MTAGRAAPLILIVGDEPAQRMLCRKALTAAGFDSLEAEDGNCALGAFGRQRPDTVLLGPGMRGTDRLAACAALRALPSGRNTPILIVADSDDIQFIACAYEAGATDFITGPLDGMILVQRIRYMLRADESFRRLKLSEQRLAEAQLQDISERKCFETERASAREAQEADASRATFLATMSHELRTPLNAIIGFSELIAMEAFGPIPPKYREYAHNIITAGQHMSELIGDILTMAKLESGRYELHLEEVPLLPTAEATIALFRGTEIARGHRITLLEKGDWKTIRADQRTVKQMLLNLLSNAAKFSPAGSTIQVQCLRGDDGTVRLSVIDHGIGMTPEEAIEAVLPFRQIDTRLARKYEGTGLGLSIVKRLIERHGGSLAIDSVPAQGTRVSLVFPAGHEFA